MTSETDIFLYSMKNFLLIIMFVGLVPDSMSQAYKFSGNELVIDNGSIKRIIKCTNHSLVTEGLYLAGNERNYVRSSSPEFRFLMNGLKMSGDSGWKVISCKPSEDANGGNGTILNLEGQGQAEGIELAVSYLSYPGLPVIRKHITFRNTSS